MRIALLSHAGAIKFAQVADALQTRGVPIFLAVFEGRKPPPFTRQIWQAVAREGFGSLSKKIFRKVLRRPRSPTVAPAGTGSKPWPPASRYAADNGLKVLSLPDFNSAESLARLKAEGIDLFVHAGAGILRADLLALPRIGTLNAHMGLLPSYRGMNVVEWAALNNAPVGCTVHFIDPGIDTGAIVATREVSTEGARSVAELRGRVDTAQLLLLAEVVGDIFRTGRSPEGKPQTGGAGKQYFAMHRDLYKILQDRLSRHS